MPNMPFRSRLAVQCILQILLEIARSLEVELGVLDTHLDHVALLSEEEFLRAEAEQAEDVLEFGGDVFWEDGARWCEELVYSVDVGHVCDVLSIVAEDCRGPRGHCRRDTLYIRAACPERQIDTLKIMLPKLLHTLSCTISLYLQLFDLTPNHPPAIDASPFRRLPQSSAMSSSSRRFTNLTASTCSLPSGTKPTAAYALCMALTRTCREMRADTLAMFYAIVEFMFQVGILDHVDPLGSIRSIKVWLDKNINHIATLHIKLEDSCWAPNGGLSKDW